MTLDAASAGQLSVDQRSLDALRTQAASDPRAAIRATARQFEAVFMETVMKSMREATQQAFGSSSSESQGTATFTTMLDAQFARTFAGRPGGLAQMLEQQLMRQFGAPPAGGAPSATGGVDVPKAASGAAPVTAPRAAGAGERHAFVDALLPHALEAQKASGVPALYILGQAALESGWGKHEIRGEAGERSHNLFGIKASAKWRGDSTEALTTEFEDGLPHKRTERFRAYGSRQEAFADYARLVSSPRYAGVLAPGSTPEQFAAAMQRAGYATDPQYAAKLARTIRETMALHASTANVASTASTASTASAAPAAGPRRLG